MSNNRGSPFLKVRTEMSAENHSTIGQQCRTPKGSLKKENWHLILLAAMNEAIVKSPFPQITPELWRFRRETSGLPRLQMS